MTLLWNLCSNILKYTMCNCAAINNYVDLSKSDGRYISLSERDYAPFLLSIGPSNRVNAFIPIFIVLSFASYSAVAKDFDVTETEPLSTWYLGAKAGFGTYAGGCESSASECSRSSEAGGVFGGYYLTEQLSIEAGYTYLGKAKATYPSGVASASMSSWDGYLRYQHPLNSSVSLTGKVGLSRWESDYEHPMLEQKTSGSDIGIGGGLLFQIQNNWQTQLEYQFIDGIGDQFVGKADHHMLTISLIYAPISYRNTTTSYHVIDETKQKKTLHEKEFHEELFAVDSSKILDESKLDGIASILNKHPNATVEIIGATDNTGTSEYNQKLSMLRAEEVARVLEARGVARARMTIKGEGETNPVSSNSTAEGRAKNRHVFITISDYFESELNVKVEDHAE